MKRRTLLAAMDGLEAVTRPALAQAFPTRALRLASPRGMTSTAGGLITKPGHKLEGMSAMDKNCFFQAKGGIAAASAFYDIKAKDSAPSAFVFGVTNPVMVQGAVLAGIPITDCWSPDPRVVLRNGDRVRVDQARRLVELLERAAS
jgi:predicted aconitase with swiveling domain